MFEMALKDRKRTQALLISTLVVAAALCSPTTRAQPAPSPQATTEAVRGMVLGGLPFAVRQLGVEGVTVFDTTALLQFATALHRRGEGGELTVWSVAQAMALIYREDGYPLAEVTWRTDAAAGSVVWVVSEGHIEQIRLSGLDDATATRTLRYLTPLTQLRLPT